MFHVMTQDHQLPDLVWNEQTRIELRSTLDSEITEYEREQRLKGLKKLDGKLFVYKLIANNLIEITIYFILQEIQLFVRKKMKETINLFLIDMLSKNFFHVFLFLYGLLNLKF